VGVYETEHCPAVSVQVVLLNVPLPLDDQLTVPVGVLEIPLSVSVTVAVHVVEESTGTVEGEQLTFVSVWRVVARTSAVPELAPCFSLPEYVPVIVWVPTSWGVYVTEQLDRSPFTRSGMRRHDELLNVPLPLDAQLTVPLGGLFVPALASKTVAVHVVGLSTGT